MIQSLKGAFVVVIGLFLVALPGQARAQLVLYDDFSSLVINPDKWQGSEMTTGPLLLNTDISREVNPDIAPLLRMSLTSYGSTASDSGLSGAGRNNLLINNPSPVTAIQTDVTVTYRPPVADDCPANATATDANASIVGFFFNDGSSSGPTDRTGNVAAGFIKRLNSRATNQFLAFLAHCTDPACLFGTTLSFQFFASTWSAGSPDTLRLQWMQGTGQLPLTQGLLARKLSCSAPPSQTSVCRCSTLRHSESKTGWPTAPPGGYRPR